MSHEDCPPDVPEIEAGSKKEVCPFCLHESPANARICGTCGTLQHTPTRMFYKASATLAVVATVFSIITAGVALGPQALAYLFPAPKPKLVTFEFRSNDPNDRSLGEFTLFNSGNVDAYILRVILSSKDPRYPHLGKPNISIFEVLKTGEGFAKQIMFMDHGEIRRKNLPDFQHLDERTYNVALEAVMNNPALKIRKVDPENCFTVLPLQSLLGLGAPKEKKYRHMEADLLLQGKLEYLDMRSPNKVKYADFDDMHMEGAIYLHPICIFALGGKEKVKELLGEVTGIPPVLK